MPYSLQESRRDAHLPAPVQRQTYGYLSGCRALPLPFDRHSLPIQLRVGGCVGPQESAPTWHLDQCSHFCTDICVTNTQTHSLTQTDIQTMLRVTSVAIGRILCSVCDAA